MELFICAGQLEPCSCEWGELKNEFELFNSIPEFELELKENELNLIFLCWCNLVYFQCGPQSNL